MSRRTWILGGAGVAFVWWLLRTLRQANPEASLHDFISFWVIGGLLVIEVVMAMALMGILWDGHRNPDPQLEEARRRRDAAKEKAAKQRSWLPK